MKNYFFIIVFFVLLFSCEKKLPSSPTIVTGKVVDESEMPIEGYEFQFSGFNQTGILKGNVTFNLYSSTNKEGVFTFSQVVPQETDRVQFSPVGLKAKTPSGYDVLYSDIFLIKDGQNVGPGATGPINYGVTNHFNYKVIKRKP